LAKASRAHPPTTSSAATRAWVRGVPTFTRLRYEEVYPGVDAVFSGAGDSFEYDFVVNPSASPEAIRIGFAGSDDARIDATGALVVRMHGGEIRHNAPVAYQLFDGVKRPVASRFVERCRGEFGFEVGAYDPSLPLVIDPVIEFSTYFGAGQDFAWAVATDSEGNIDATGSTLQEATFPVTRPRPEAGNAFVYKISPSGELLFSILFGGHGGDDGINIALDAHGNVVVVGASSSYDFPLVDPFDTTFGSYSTGFVTVFSPDASSILFSTRFGGAYGSSAVTSVACGASGRIYFSGYSEGSLILENAADSTQAGLEGFVAAIEPRAHRIVYSTYLGGSGAAASTKLTTKAGRGYVYSPFDDVQVLNPDGTYSNTLTLQ
jgi:hypothetical protein